MRVKEITIKSNLHSYKLEVAGKIVRLSMDDEPAVKLVQDKCSDKDFELVVQTMTIALLSCPTKVEFDRSIKQALVDRN